MNSPVRDRFPSDTHTTLLTSRHHHYPLWSPAETWGRRRGRMRQSTSVGERGRDRHTLSCALMPCHLLPTE